VPARKVAVPAAVGDDRWMSRPTPCRICRQWFRPDLRLGDRQRVCSAPACQAERQRRNVAAWKQLHPDDAVKRRIVARQRCAARDEPVDPLTVPAPLDRLPWAVAQTEFKVQGADFLAHMGRLLLGAVRK